MSFYRGTPACVSPKRIIQQSEPQSQTRLSLLLNHVFIPRLCGIVCDKNDLDAGRIISHNLEGASVTAKKVHNHCIILSLRQSIQNIMQAYTLSIISIQKYLMRGKYQNQMRDEFQYSNNKDNYYVRNNNQFRKLVKISTGYSHNLKIIPNIKDIIRYSYFLTGKRTTPSTI